MQISLVRLKSFLTVARAQSLREASDILGVTQPALSKQIAQLEDEIGRPLFQRHGRGMSLTSAGQALLDGIGGSVDHLEAAVHMARDHDELDAGQLRLTSLSTLAAYLIPAAAALLHTKFPRVRLLLLVNNSVEVVEMIERGKADIGVVYDVAVDTDAFVVHPLHDERIAVFAKAGAFGLETGNVDVEELLRLPLLLPPRPYALRRVLERECGRELDPVAECSTADLVLRLASLGVGVGVLPELMPREMVEGCGLRRLSLLGGKISRRVVAITRIDDDKSPLISEGLGALQQTMRP